MTLPEFPPLILKKKKKKMGDMLLWPLSSKADSHARDRFESPMLETNINHLLLNVFFGFLNEKAIENVVIFTQKREVKPNVSAFSKTSNPKALSSQELIFYSMLPNFQQWHQRLSVGKYLLSLGLKSDLGVYILMLSTFPFYPKKLI